MNHGPDSKRTELVENENIALRNKLEQLLEFVEDDAVRDSAIDVLNTNRHGEEALNEVRAEALEAAASMLNWWQSAEAHIGEADLEGPNGPSTAYRLFVDAVEDPATWLQEQAAHLRAPRTDVT